MFNKTFALSLLSIACTAAILYFSSMPAGTGGPVGINPSGDVVHFVVYGVYAAVVFATLSRFSLSKPLAISLAIAAALGAITELVQLFVPGRVCDPVDFLFNVVGALAGLAVLHLLKRKLRRRL